jgi:Rad3-related DNA helicase
VPTGAGKSASSLLLSKLSGARTVILTATKGLQSQYDKDTKQLGGVVVVGQNNFPCILVNGLRADEGPCHDGLPCALREQCPYRVQLKKALDAKLVITNYAYWLAQTNFSSGLGDFDLMLCDEGHLCFASMENYLTIFLSKVDIQPLGLSFPESADLWNVWQSWAEVSAPIAADTANRIEQEIKGYRAKNQLVPNHVSRSYRTANGVHARLKRLASVGEQWVIQKTYHGYRFVPKWVANYSQHLFHDIPKVVLMSAILSHRSLDYLGVSNGDSRAWIEMDSHFPPENTPIWHVPTARINYRTDDYGSTIWVSRIDQIIQRRLDRKGIVFTVSYERARMLLSRSRFKDIMVTHSTGDVVQVVEKFKKMDAPAVLVSPSVTTGYDFPASSAGVRYLVVGKVPFPDSKDPVTKARYDEDKSWSSYLAMETFVQECGRATRGPEDRVECLVTDDMFSWWYWSNKHLAPKWFQDRVRGSLEVVPEPLV